MTMAPPPFPPLDLAPAILRAIEAATGRTVQISETYTYAGGYVQVIAALEEDGSVSVAIRDPQAPGGEMAV